MSDEFRRALTPKHATRRRRPGTGRTFRIAIPRPRVLPVRKGVKRRPTGRVKPRKQAITSHLRPGPRLLSFLLLILISAATVLLLTSDEFYVVKPEVVGNKTIPGDEIESTAAVDGLQIFWVDSQALESGLKRAPGIADAHVTTRLPNVVEISVTERVPVLSWSQAGATTWIDADGKPMPARGGVPNLLSVTAEDATSLLAPGAGIKPDIVAGALALKTLRPDIRSLRYFSRGGLAWDDPGGWQVYFGTGADMALRLKVYQALISNLSTRGVHPQYVVVDDVEHPFYKVLK